jgi:hypothetical protein
MIIYAPLFLISAGMLSLASYWTGVNHGWEKHKRYLKFVIQQQDNWEPLA